MTLSVGLRLTQALECRCCRNLVLEERQAETAVIAALFGATRYAICPVCLQDVPRDQWDRAYKKRWKRAILKKAKSCAT